LHNSVSKTVGTRLNANCGHRGAGKVENGDGFAQPIRGYLVLGAL